MQNVKTILESKVHAVVGTTGLNDANLNEIKKLCQKNNVNCLVAPNFAIGAVLMMKFSRDASHYMPEVEIIELHHDQKADSPSGTAIKTAEMILADRGKIKRKEIPQVEKIKGCRGGSLGDIRIHSVRLKGFVAHQEVIFGGLGQTLSIRHDSISRESFMPGVILAVRKIKKIKGLVYGLENLL
jgi:4-hydroxy-tetrahydrodipicolinate reductase